jgi:hypothetical protein
VPPKTGFMADNHVRGPALHALRKDAHVERAIDVFGQRNVDEAVFAYAADRGLIVLTSDEDFLEIANAWLKSGRTGFRMIFWKMELHAVMTDGEMVAGVWEIVTRPGAFAYPIEYLKKPT